MAGSAAKVAIEIVTEGTAAATADMGKAAGAVKNVGKAAEESSGKFEKVNTGIEGTGDTAALATTGLRDLGGAMQTMGGTVGAMGTAMVTASTAFEALDGAATLYKAAQTAATAATTAFSTAMNVLKASILTNPIFLIAAIIIGIAIALVVAYKKSETFRNIVNGAFGAVKSVIMGVWNWIKNNWPLLLAILTGPIGIAVLAITKNWDKIKAAGVAVWNWIKNTWSSISSMLSAPFNAAWDIISGIFDKISSAIQGAIDFIKKIHFPSPPSWLSAVIPGSFAAPTVAGARGATPSASVAPVTINVSGALDPEGVARQIRRIMAASDRRGGRQGVLRPVGTV